MQKLNTDEFAGRYQTRAFTFKIEETPSNKEKAFRNDQHEFNPGR